VAVADDDCGRTPLRVSGETMAENAGWDRGGVFGDCGRGETRPGFQKGAWLP